MESLSLSQRMKCALLSNDNGDILISHDKPLKSSIEWVEFDNNSLSLLLVYTDGTNQNLGIKVPTTMVPSLKKGTEVKISHIEDKMIKSVQKTIIVIQDY